LSENFYTILTATGKAKLANSATLGSKVNFKTLKVGDGKGTYYEPSEDQTSLANKVWEGNINSISIDEINSNWIVIETIIPATDGGFFIREAGIFDEDEDLIAVSKISETYKPVISEGSTKDISIKIVLEVSNVDSVTLKIDPNVIVATKKDIQVLESKVQGVNEQLSDMDYQIAGGTAIALTLPMQTLRNGYTKNFIASASNGGVATTINNKPIYKPGSTTPPNFIKDKAYTIWYNLLGGCFFIKASAEGNTITSHVLAGDTFSNDTDTGLLGTLDLTYLVSGNVRSGVTINGITGKSSVVETSSANANASNILSGKTGYVNGYLITGNIPTYGNEEYAGWRRATVSTASMSGRVHLCIPDGYYNGTANGGMQGVFSDDANFSAANLLAGKTYFGLAGSLPNLLGVRSNPYGIGKWGNGDLAVYPEPGYQKGGVGDGEIRVLVSQLQGIGYKNYASGTIATPTSTSTITVGFQPTFVILHYTNSSSQGFMHYNFPFFYGEVGLSSGTSTSAYKPLITTTGFTFASTDMRSTPDASGITYYSFG